VSGRCVVFGAGALGLAVARTLRRADRQVRVATRSGRAAAPDGVEVVAADARDRAATARACDGAEVVYHCAAAPYGQWPGTLPGIMEGIIAAAVSAGARVVYGDNLYAYGPVAGPLTEDLPYRPPGPHGRVRAEVAEALMAAHRRGTLRAAIGRASDFYGPGVRLSMVGDRVFPRALAGRPAQVLPSPDMPHTFTFIDDFADALVTLGEREEALGEVWHVPNAETVTTRRFVGMVFTQAGTTPKLRVAPRLAIMALALVNPSMRAVKERLYQTERPFVVDHSKYERAFGGTATPHPDAIQQTLDWLRTAGEKRTP
jgi:nucleoside-diphosphate-sugar epimerase